MSDREVWTKHADDLADHALAHMANRLDVFGVYRDGEAITAKKRLTKGMLRGHFMGECTLGLHALSRDNKSKWLCFDVDAHHGEDATETLRYAAQLWDGLIDLGFDPTLFSSDGNGSYHVLVLFDRPVSGASVCQFGKSFLLDHKSDIGAEFFPKQPDAKYGSWLRLWGHHHKRDHWHRIWDGNLLDAESTNQWILSLEGDDPTVICDERWGRRCNEWSQEQPRFETPVAPSEATEEIISNGAEPGQRNCKLFEAAADLFGRGHDEADIVETLLPAFSEAGLSEREIRRTIKSCCAKPRTPRTEPEAGLVVTTRDRFVSAGEPDKSADIGVGKLPGKLADTGTDKTEPCKSKYPPILPITEIGDGVEPDFLWAPYLAAGHSTLLTGLWKAGKSTLLAHLLQGFGSGGKLVGDIATANVLVVSEESETHWRRRREELSIGAHVYLQIMPFIARPSLPDWYEYMNFLAEQVIERNIGVVCFDTISRFWPVSDENDAPKVLAALAPVYALTGNGLALLLIHHPRKGDADQGQASRGSGAFPGYVDTLIELRRFAPRDLEDRRRTLTALSRFPDVPAEVVIELGDSGYVCVGDKGAAKRRDRMSIVRDLLPDKAPGRALEEIRNQWPQDAVKPTRETLRRDMVTAVEQGVVERTGEGKPHDPHRFWKRSVCNSL